MAQDGSDWGAVVVDDASTNGFGDYAEILLADHLDQVTIVRNTTRKGLLYNTWNAITNYCADPQSVIITLDADDALIGTGVIVRLRQEYDNGADATVGSMLRLDKEAVYPVDFERPRWWTSNVWQHLRTFRKYLFDAIDIDDLKLDREWIDVATDWAFMVPIIEMAENPTYIPETFVPVRAVGAETSDRSWLPEFGRLPDSGARELPATTPMIRDLSGLLDARGRESCGMRATTSGHPGRSWYV